MGLFTPYVYKTKKSKKKEKYYLHMKKKGKRILYYFSKDPTDALRGLPAGYEVVENPNTGLPMLRKKAVSGVFGTLVGVGKKRSRPK